MVHLPGCAVVAARALRLRWLRVTLPARCAGGRRPLRLPAFIACLCIMQSRGTLALAFSGGLDTSYCVPRLAEDGWAVHTVYVDTGGSTADERAAIRRQAERRRRGRAPRGRRPRAGLRPLRPLPDPGQRAPRRGLPAQRRRRADPAGALGGRGGARRSAPGRSRTARPAPATTRSGSTSRSACSRPTSRSSPRSATLGVKREQAIAYLEAARPAGARQGRRLLASTAGSGARPGAAAGPTTPGPARPPSCSIRRPTRPRRARSCSAGSAGCRSRSTATRSPGPALVAALGDLAGAYGIGRSIHVGETALGIKGRIGFEAGAALLLIAAHRELEKLVLTKWQAFWKDQLGRFYGDRLHEGQYFDPGAPRHRGADHQLAGAGHRRHPGAPRRRPVPGRRHAEPALDDGHAPSPPTARRTGSGPATRRGRSPGSRRCRRCSRRGRSGRGTSREAQSSAGPHVQSWKH